MYENWGPKFIQIAYKSGPEGGLEATSAMQAKLKEFRTPNLEKNTKIWDPNSSQNDPRIHPLEELEVTSHPSLVWRSFSIWFYMFFWYQNHWKIYSNWGALWGSIFDLLLPFETDDADVLQKLESTQTLGGLFKNRLCGCYSLCESSIQSAS